MKNHYVTIEEHSGYVWGECHAESALEACAKIDADIGEHGFTYEEVHRTERYAYSVYILSDDIIHQLNTRNLWPINGPDRETIALIENAAEHVCYVATSKIDT